MECALYNNKAVKNNIKLHRLKDRKKCLQECHNLVDKLLYFHKQHVYGMIHSSTIS